MSHALVWGARRAPEKGPEDQLTESGQNRALQAAVEQLPRRQREVLHLVFYQDLTIQESAQMLGIALGTARTHFERGKRQLRDLLAKVGNDDGRS